LSLKAGKWKTENWSFRDLERRKGTHNIQLSRRKIPKRKQEFGTFGNSKPEEGKTVFVCDQD